MASQRGTRASTVEVFSLDVDDKYTSTYRRPKTCTGYTGHLPQSDDDEHVLESPMKKFMIRGYTGHRSHLRHLVGEPLIPSEKRQLEISGLIDTEVKEIEREDQVNDNFRAHAKHLDILERYGYAADLLSKRGQSQQGLLSIVKAKLSQRVNTFAMQRITTRNLFEEFDINGDGVLDEGEFRACLEKMNIQFDDIQVLALFAFFDDDNDGFVEWKEFADHAMVANPKGGTAVLPKMIIQTYNNV
jgi:hypothetical protein